MTSGVATESDWVVVATVPQVGGGHRDVLRQDPARLDGLWCPVRTRDR